MQHPLRQVGERVLATLCAVPENPGVPSGSSTKRGVYRFGGGLTLKSVAWIQRPEDYYQVDMDGHVSPDLTTYSGAMDDPACTTFYVTRQQTP